MNIETIEKSLGTSVLYFDRISSTNDYAAENPLAPRTVVIAGEQSEGRGRVGHTFFSPSGGVYFSYIVSTETLADPQLVTVRAAAAAAEAIETLSGKETGIKWVNDIFQEGKKVAGILCECVGGRIILGVGVNLAEDFPEELSALAGGIGNVSKEELIIGIIRNFEAQQDRDRLLESYTNRLLVLNREVSFTLDHKVCRGVAVGVDREGGLIVDTDAGRVVLNSGEISIQL